MANILVVDDDEIILKIAKAILQKAGHSVTLVKDGHTAIDTALKEIFHLIITDANMPGGVSGFSLAATVRKNEKLQHTPIMFLTGRRDKADVSRAVGVGADDYSIKPIVPEIFLEKVEALLLGKRGALGLSVPIKKTSASWTLKFEIVAVSEHGVTIHTTSPMPLQAKIRIESEIFTQIGIKAPLFRIVVCQPVEAPEKHFLVSATFVQLDQPDQESICKWLATHNPRKRSA